MREEGNFDRYIREEAPFVLENLQTNFPWALEIAPGEVEAVRTRDRKNLSMFRTAFINKLDALSLEEKKSLADNLWKYVYHLEEIDLDKRENRLHPRYFLFYDRSRIADVLLMKDMLSQTGLEDLVSSFKKEERAYSSDRSKSPLGEIRFYLFEYRFNRMLNDFAIRCTPFYNYGATSAGLFSDPDPSEREVQKRAKELVEEIGIQKPDLKPYPVDNRRTVVNLTYLPVLLQLVKEGFDFHYFT